jgi:hypothetical protein
MLGIVKVYGHPYTLTYANKQLVQQTKRIAKKREIERDPIGIILFLHNRFLLCGENRAVAG